MSGAPEPLLGNAIFSKTGSAEESMRIGAVRQES